MPTPEPVHAPAYTLPTMTTEVARPRRTEPERRELAEKLAAIVGAESVLWEDYDLMLYEYDGSIDKHRAEAVVFPKSSQDVSRVITLCNARGVPWWWSRCAGPRAATSARSR